MSFTQGAAPLRRLYDRLGLLSPARVDGDSGYRLCTEDQVEVAQLVGLLRRLDMPLALIASLLEMDAAAARRAVATYWGQVEQSMSDQRELVSYLQARLAGNRPTGDKETMYAIEVRCQPERKLLTVNRHEAYIRLAKKDISWPALLPACDALARWVTEHDRQPAGALRQLLIADHRTATPETFASDLAIPLRRVASGAGGLH